MNKGAVLSLDNVYRYRLWRRWGDGPTLGYILLNPSTADAEADDPTITRCIKRAQRLGCGAIEVGNLFALRSTEAAALYRAAFPIGPDNDAAIEAVVRASKIVVCGWGVHGLLHGRGRAVANRIQHELGRIVHVLDLCANGEPKHPLYIPLNRDPVPIDVD